VEAARQTRQTAAENQRGITFMGRFLSRQGLEDTSFSRLRDERRVSETPYGQE
jgi:hypothetical protein